MLHANTRFCGAFLAAAISFVVPEMAHANVSIKNGNFFVGYADITLPGGLEPKIERIYNSKSSHVGMFGWGWGAEIEVYVESQPDGTVIVHESGGGAWNVFEPHDARPFEVDRAVTLLTTFVPSTSKDRGAQIEKLRNDRRYRAEEWAKLRPYDADPHRFVPLGAGLSSQKFGFQTLIRVPDGFLRASGSDRFERFDARGKLVRLADRDGNAIDFFRDERGKIRRITDNLGRVMVLDVNDQDLVTRIRSNSGSTVDEKVCTYVYNEQKELVESTNADGETYRYSWSLDGRHNLIRIGHEGTNQEIAYYGMDQQEGVRSVRSADGSQTAYRYSTKNAQQDEHCKAGTNYVSEVTETFSFHISPTTRSYEYFDRTTSAGALWTCRMKVTDDGEMTDTVYNENGLPKRIVAPGGRVTSFTYDEKGHVTRKEEPTLITELEYSQLGKVTKVTRKDPISKKVSLSASYIYDGTGHLLSAQSEGKTIYLEYELGRIKTLKGEKTIHFEYNKVGRPIRISIGDSLTERIDIEYNDDGEIKKVDSPGGPKVSLSVTSAFQDLLDIIRPAGVTLSF